MRRRTAKGRSRQLEREIAEALSHGTQGSSGSRRRHHATIRECTTWPVDTPIEQLTAAKKQSAAEFERCYLVNLMQRAGTVSEAARLAGLDRSNFKKLLHRHGLRARE